MTTLSKLTATSVLALAGLALPFSANPGALTQASGESLLTENVAYCAEEADCPSSGCKGGWDGCAVLPNGVTCLTKAEVQPEGPSSEIAN